MADPVQPGPSAPKSANRLSGTDGADTLAGTDAADTIVGFGGGDLVDGAGGDDRVAAGLGDDTVSGGAGRDMLRGDGGVDRLFGGAGNDTLVGGAGLDKLEGGEGADLLYGDDIVANAKTLGMGLPGGDAILGGLGADTIVGGAGDDTLSGGAGADRFVLGLGDGGDRITDFSAAEGDRIDLSAYRQIGRANIAQHVTTTAEGARVDLGDGNVVQVVTGTALQADDFIFAASEGDLSSLVPAGSTSETAATGDLPYAPNTAGALHFLGGLAVAGGTVSSPTDVDSFRVHLTAGTEFKLWVVGAGKGAGTLADPVAYLFRGMTLVAADDDSGRDLDAEISYTPAESGIYELAVAGYGGATGSYVAFAQIGGVGVNPYDGFDGF